MGCIMFGTTLDTEPAGSALVRISYIKDAVCGEVEISK